LFIVDDLEANLDFGVLLPPSVFSLDPTVSFGLFDVSVDLQRKLIKIYQNTSLTNCCD
jgi:hypothetical protein